MNIYIWPEDVNGGDRCDDLDVDEMLILKYIKLNKARKCVYWLYVAQDKDKWRGITNPVMSSSPVR